MKHRSGKFFIGLMSGTSLDAIDAVLVELEDSHPPVLLSSCAYPLSPKIRNDIETLCQPGTDEINRMGELDRQLGGLFAEAVEQLLDIAAVARESICAIGCHGQTIRHHPANSSPFTLQIGDANTIAFRTGITTVADFRRMDIAAGGQGAPLVPAFHQAVFRHPGKNRVVVNIGGMANITVLAKDEPVTGFDTGPGNVLMDSWIGRHRQLAFDKDGDWAKTGNCHALLLDRLMSHPFLQLRGPKSTGREAFHLQWLDSLLDVMPPIISEDVQRTLLEFTARTIADSIWSLSFNHVQHVILCGGGSHNRLLKSRLGELLTGITIDSSDELGVPADWVEAMAFAWLAKQRLEGRPGNIPEVTGASRACMLGGVYLPG